jgi:hypothetical protein
MADMTTSRVNLMKLIATVSIATRPIVQRGNGIGDLLAFAMYILPVPLLVATMRRNAAEIHARIFGPYSIMHDCMALLMTADEKPEAAPHGAETFRAQPIDFLSWECRGLELRSGGQERLCPWRPGASGPDHVLL